MKPGRQQGGGDRHANAKTGSAVGTPADPSMDRTGGAVAWASRSLFELDHHGPLHRQFEEDSSTSAPTMIQAIGQGTSNT